jgi:hypothetical protein
MVFHNGNLWNDLQRSFRFTRFRIMLQDGCQCTLEASSGAPPASLVLDRGRRKECWIAFISLAVLVCRIEIVLGGLGWFRGRVVL